MTPIFYSPDCAYDKHGACNGDAWNDIEDVPADCDCWCHDEEAA